MLDVEISPSAVDGSACFVVRHSSGSVSRCQNTSLLVSSYYKAGVLEQYLIQIGKTPAVSRANMSFLDCSGAFTIYGAVNTSGGYLLIDRSHLVGVKSEADGAGTSLSVQYTRVSAGAGALARRFAAITSFNWVLPNSSANVFELLTGAQLQCNTPFTTNDTILLDGVSSVLNSALAATDNFLTNNFGTRAFIK